MAWSDWVNVLESTPTDANYANEIDDYMQTLAEAVGDRLAGLIYGFATGETTEAIGLIEAIFKQKSADPTVSADTITLYAKNVGANNELFAKDEAGNVVQLTSGGKLMIGYGTASQAVMHNTTEEDTEGGRESQIRAKGEQSGGEETTLGYLEFSHSGTSDDEKGKFLIKLNDGNDADAPSVTALTLTPTTAVLTGVTTLPDTSALATSGAPAADAQIVNKKYVDDQITAIQDPAYSGGESHTFDGGLIIKMGYVAEVDASTSVTFAVAFPTGIISVLVTPKRAAGTTTVNVVISAAATTGFTIKGGAGFDGYYWQAIGY